MSNKVTIISLVATGAGGITLYTDDAKSIDLPLEGWRTKAILDEVQPMLAQRKKVTIDLDNYSVEKKVEQNSGGFIRFIKRKLKDFVGHFNLGSYGNEPVKREALEVSTSPAAIVAVVGDQPTGPVLNPETETLVAVVNGVEIPGMEKLEKQIEYAAFKNVKGLQAFLDRVSKVIDKRGHSVQELLNFIQRADLPIADDGTIVGYKILRFSEYGNDDVFVDCHTRKVHQRVGSRVSMAESLVDPNRRVECSVGLHVARRGYVSGFAGDLITLIKVAPEDVIAVPYKEPDKMRAAAYHIVALVPNEGYQLLRQNKPMTTHEPSAKILANVIAGDHIDVIEDVVIGSANGGNVVTTPRKAYAQTAVIESVAEAKTDVAKVEALDEKTDKTVVSVKEIKKAADEAAQQRIAAKKIKAETKKDSQRADEFFAKPKKASKSTKTEPLKKDLMAKTNPVVAEPTPTPAKANGGAAYNGKVPAKYLEAYNRVQRGEISQREAEKQYGISAKKLRALRREVEGK